MRNLIFLEKAKIPSLLGCLSLKHSSEDNLKSNVPYVFAEKNSSNNAANCLDAAVCVLAVLLGAAVPRAAAPPLPVRGVHPGRGPGHPIPSTDSRLDHLTHRWAPGTLNQSFIV